MDVQKFSALKEWNVWTYQLQALVQCVGPALLGTLEMYRNAMVSITLKQQKKIIQSLCREFFLVCSLCRHR